MEIIKRNVSVDILRILLAFMVVTIHIGAPSTGNVINQITWMPNKLFAYFVHYSSIPAVNIYILISGYFSYKQLESKNVFKKAISLWMILFFYSVVGFTLSIIFFNESFTVNSLIHRVFLLSTGEWWFMTNYFCLLLLSPFLNTIISSLTKKTFSCFFCFVVIIFGILPAFDEWKDPIGLNYGYSLIWFIPLYIIGGGIKRFSLGIKNKGFQKFFFMYILMTFVILAQEIFFAKILHMANNAFSHYNSFTILLQAIFLFLAFVNLKIGGGKINNVIVFISSLSLSVYIFHCQTDISKVLWNITTPSQYADSIYLPLVYISLLLGVFIIACLTEYLRKQLFKALKIEKIPSRIVNFFSKTL